MNIKKIVAPVVGLIVAGLLAAYRVRERHHGQVPVVNRGLVFD